MITTLSLTLVAWILVFPGYYIWGYSDARRKISRLINGANLTRSLNRLSSRGIKSKEEEWREIGALDAYLDVLNILYNPKNAAWLFLYLTNTKTWVKQRFSRKAKPNGTK